MNKKFFAALASATMAFTASGSIAVFADDFVEEKTPVINNGQVAPKPTTVKWNKENFGDLATEDGKVNPAVKFEKTFTPDEKGYVVTKALEAVTGITFNSFEGEIKGLDYFTGLKEFSDANATLKNKSLDFSANKVLNKVSVTKATDLTEIVLPEPVVTEKDGKEVVTYSLAELTLTGTALTSLDLSAQNKLGTVTVTGNNNLKEVAVQHGTKREYREYSTLNLSANNLDTVNLDYVEITGELNLDANHIGALDLSNTTAPKGATLGEQTFYVSETLENVNLAETFENFDKKAVAKSKAYDQETGVLTLSSKATTTYSYDTLVNGADTKTLSVKLEKANPMNRLYNPNSGEHFYTADINEKAALVALGWQDEGYGWVAPTKATGQKSGKPVFRLYNPNAGDHHYTTDDKEVKTLVAYGWKDEGTGWYSAGKVAVYRQYNPYANGAGSHNYTTDKAENDYLVSLGWTPEGTAWFALQ